MKRRGMLAVTALALAGCAGDKPRATGPRTPPDTPAGSRRETTSQPDLILKTFDVKADEEGDVLVFGTVGNRGDVRHTGTVTATVTAGGESPTNATEVTVQAGDELDFEIPFAVSYETFRQSGGVNVSVSG